MLHFRLTVDKMTILQWRLLMVILIESKTKRHRETPLCKSGYSKKIIKLAFKSHFMAHSGKMLNYTKVRRTKWQKVWYYSHLLRLCLNVDMNEITLLWRSSGNDKTVPQYLFFNSGLFSAKWLQQGDEFVKHQTE